MFPGWARRPIYTAALGAMLFPAGCGNGSGTGGVSGRTEFATGLVIMSFEPAPVATAIPGDRVKFSVNVQSSNQPSYRWSVDGLPQPVRDERMFLSTSPQDTSIHTVAVDVRDGADDVTSVVWRVQLVEDPDNQQPEITSVIPSAPVNVTRGEVVSFSATAADPDVGDLVYYSWALDGSDLVEGESFFQIATGNLASGDHVVEVTATDGHTHSEAPATHAYQFTVTAATTANRVPIIDSASPGSAIRITGGSALNLNVNASDPEGDSLSYQWALDGVGQGVSGNSLRYVSDGADTGSHLVQVIVDDRQFHSSGFLPGYAWTITVTAPDPAPTSSPPVPPPPPLPKPGGPSTGSSTVELTWSKVSMYETGLPAAVGGYKVYRATTPGGITTPETIVTAPQALLSLSRGNVHYISVSAYDVSGNEGPRSQAITVLIP